ncbi:hypothetical protein F8M41_011273 [Gigaspora margarita]|uniref:Uncharacterized protein n=1 Tax=Gigaspora margarita TaxID=4874 RepID=A0A8H3X188_GIGMA|nr:hypothetical protein F8M41_011273 [Gigaspora margarita]
MQLNKRAISFKACSDGSIESLTVKLGTDPPGSEKNESFDRAGTPFKIDVPTPKLPDSYIIGVVVSDIADDPNKAVTIFACALATVG